MSQESDNLNQYPTIQQNYETIGSSPYFNNFIGENSNTDPIFNDNHNYPSNDVLDENENNNDVHKNSSFYNQENIYNFEMYDDCEKGKQTVKNFYNFTFEQSDDKKDPKTLKSTTETDEEKQKDEIKETFKKKILNIQNKNEENLIITKEDKNNKSKNIFKVLTIKRHASEELTYKIGNKLPYNSLRIDNLKNKVIRNFIQDIIPNWVCIKTGKKNKLNRDYLIFNYKNYLHKKLAEIYKEQLETYINDIFIGVKLEFTLKEAFICFASEEMRKSTLQNVLSRLKINFEKFEKEKFFVEFDKEIYIEQKSNDDKEKAQINKAFSSLINDISGSNESSETNCI